jgi:hypothetical protein
MTVLIVAPGHPDLGHDAGAGIAHALFEGLRAAGAAAVLLAGVDRSEPALFKPGAHITAFDGRPDEYLFLSHGVDPWWHKHGEPLLVEAFAAFLGLIAPDIVHFHGVATLGAELPTLTRRILPGSRIVFTLHDFLPICAAEGKMLRLTDGTPCDRASPLRCHQCFPAIAPERFFLRAGFLRAHLAAVDAIAIHDEAMRDRFVHWGLPAERLALVPDSEGAAMVEGYRALYAAG